jgi:hypothetical protein
MFLTKGVTSYPAAKTTNFLFSSAFRQLPAEVLGTQPNLQVLASAGKCLAMFEQLILLG